MLAEKSAEVSEHVPTMTLRLREITEQLTVSGAMIARGARWRRQSCDRN
jgi:hypothetical protein